MHWHKQCLLENCVPPATLPWVTVSKQAWPCWIILAHSTCPSWGTCSKPGSAKAPEIRPAGSPAVLASPASLGVSRATLSKEVDQKFGRKELGLPLLTPFICGGPLLFGRGISQLREGSGTGTLIVTAPRCYEVSPGLVGRRGLAWTFEDRPGWCSASRATGRVTAEAGHILQLGRLLPSVEHQSPRMDAGTRS